MSRDLIRTIRRIGDVAVEACLWAYAAVKTAGAIYFLTQALWAAALLFSAGAAAIVGLIYLRRWLLAWIDRRFGR